MKKDAYYFSHDANARNDVKILRLRRMLGVEGYGIYFMIIEVLREQSKHCLSLAEACDLAFDFHVNEEKIMSVINDFGLFKKDENCFFSQRLIDSMESFNELKNRLSEAGRKGGLISAQARLKQPSSIKEKKIKEKKKEKQPFSLTLKKTAGNSPTGPDDFEISNNVPKDW